jgi:hypothetical protein
VYEFEPPDVLHSYVNATLQISEIEELHKIITHEIVPKVGRIFHLIHFLPEVGGFTPEARRYAGSLPVDVFKAMLILGGNPVVRSVMTIISRASELLTGGPPTKIFKTEEEAYAYIKEFRATEQAKSVQS